MPDIETIKMFFNYGVPAGLLMALVIVVYRVSVSAGLFLGPIIKELATIIKDLATKHVQTMETFEVVGTGLLDQQKAQTELMKRHDGMLGDQTTKINEIHEAVVKK